MEQFWTHIYLKYFFLIEKKPSAKKKEILIIQGVKYLGFPQNPTIDKKYNIEIKLNM